MTSDASSLASSLAVDGFDQAADELMVILAEPPSAPAKMKRVELEERTKEPVEVRNFIKAAELAYTADVNLRSAGLLANDEMEMTSDAYDCDDECAHDEGGQCAAMCRKWKQAWDPILKLLGDACDDHATTFASLPTATSAVASLTSIQSKFAELARDTAAAKKQHTTARSEFVARAYNVICNENGREFHKVRCTIRNQMCCVDKASRQVGALCKEVLDTFAGRDTDLTWLAQDPTAMGKHLAKASQEHLVSHVKTLDDTAAQLSVFEKAVFRLADGCTSIMEKLRTQLSALRNSKPNVLKPVTGGGVSDWKRTATPDPNAQLETYGDCVYGHGNCSDDAFVACLRAFLDTEPDCDRIVYDGSVFFRDCYQNLAWYMEQHLKCTERMQTAFLSLGGALVQQRFIVHIGALLVRAMTKTQLRTDSKSGKQETPLDVFGILYGPTFRSTMPDADFYAIQLELNSKGTKLPNTLHTYLRKVYTPKHMDTIQKAGNTLFTSELNSLADIVTQCNKQLDTSDVTVSRDRAMSSITNMNRLCQAVLKYLDKKHACTTAHCDCCPVSKSKAKPPQQQQLVTTAKK